MITVRTAMGLLGRWATASHEGALANARTASVQCSQARVERAEVEAYLEALYAPASDLTARAEAVSR